MTSAFHQDPNKGSSGSTVQTKRFQAQQQFWEKEVDSYLTRVRLKIIGLAHIVVGCLLKRSYGNVTPHVEVKKSCVTENDTHGRRRVQSQAVINNMRQDDVSFHVRSDSLICRYGESLYSKHGLVKSRHQHRE